MMNRVLSGLALVLATSVAQADVWVWDPSASLDQRFDDNYTISPRNPSSVSATRVVGSLGLSRESQAMSIEGLLRADALLTIGDDGSGGAGGELNSNRILYLDFTRTQARSEYGVNLNAKVDTPSRDISADLTDISSTAEDTGASVTQTENVARQRVIVSPYFTYNLSRRATLDTELSFSRVTHSLPSTTDSIRKQFILGNPGVDVPDNLTIDDVGVFTVADELDDFNEQAIDVAYRYQLTPISTLSFFAGYSRFDTTTEADPSVVFAFEDKIPDSEERQILRNPKRKATSNTAKFRVGWDRALTPTLTLGLQLGVFNTNFDNSDLLRESDQTSLSDEERAEKLANAEGSERGYLGSVTVTRSVGIARYTGKIGFDVLPSNVGSQVESFEAVGDYERELGPLLDFSFRVRAYEPDAINASNDNEFARRFLSMEPKLIWRFSRSWTAAASYRYRRQKSQTDVDSGVSNALLFSLKYSPPLEIRDLSNGG